jgi:type IV fimbrial biogenesis protein FimT
MLNRRLRVTGVTLIELLIALVILAIMIFIGLPSFTAWIQNTQIRTAGEGIMSGMQLARSEAVRRNVSVELRMDAGSGWTVTVPGTAEVIQTRAGGEGSSTAVVTVTPPGADKVTFGGFGRVVANGDASATITEIKIDSNVIPAADSRELCVTVSSAGVVRLCDPQVAAGDPRACIPPPPALPAGCI